MALNPGYVHCQWLLDHAGETVIYKLTKLSRQTLRIYAYLNFCRAAFEQYYYNETLDQCVKFIYGGCDGNQNRFNTLGDCQEVCKAGHQVFFCFLFGFFISELLMFPEVWFLIFYL